MKTEDNLNFDYFIEKEINSGERDKLLLSDSINPPIDTEWTRIGPAMDDDPRENLPKIVPLK